MKIKAFCKYPFERMRVTAEGNVAMCCFQRADPANNDNPYIGNLLNNSLDEIWLGSLAEEIRQATIDGNLHKNCQCSGCPYVSQKKPYFQQEFDSNDYPTFLEIDLPNTHCNVGLDIPNESHPACIMCERAAPFFQPEENHLQEVITKLKPLLPNLEQIHVQGLAEPFYKNILFDVLDWIGFDNHCCVSVTTNGTLFHKDVRQKYLERCPSSITNFSIDAATPETYKAIRVLPVFDHVLNNLYAFANERNQDKQFLRICNNINTVNLHEAVAMVDLAAKANPNILEMNPTDGFNWKILVNETNCGQFSKIQEDIITRCKELNLPYSFIRPLDLGLSEKLIQLTM